MISPHRWASEFCPIIIHLSLFIFVSYRREVKFQLDLFLNNISHKHYYEFIALPMILPRKECVSTDLDREYFFVEELQAFNCFICCHIYLYDISYNSSGCGNNGTAAYAHDHFLSTAILAPARKIIGNLRLFMSYSVWPFAFLYKTR